MTVSVNKSVDGYLYDQVSQHVMSLIQSGTLKPGDKAPSLRRLSKQLKVSISTSSQAYVTLESQGVLRAKPQSGFYVNSLVEDLPATPKKTSLSSRPRKVKFGELFEEVFQLANNPDIVPFGAAVPSVELMPVKGLVRATNRAANRYSDKSLQYCFPPGHDELRRQIALQYLEVGMSVSPDEIIITAGATEALALSLQAVAKRGDIIAVESPTYFSVLRLIERMGLLAVEIDTDPDTGMCPDTLENAFETMDIKAVLAVPNFNNPLGSLIPETSKQRLVELATRYRVPLIEDDIYGQLYFGNERPPLLKNYDQAGFVISCSSFSKTLAPGYRIGWVLAGNHYDDIIEWKQAVSSAVASLPQLAVSEFLRSGEYERHLVRVRKAFQQQVEKMRFMVGKHFPSGTRITNPQGGFVLWIEMPRGNDCLELFNQALEQGISITPGILFSATRRYRNFMRVNCGHPWNEELEKAVVTLGQLVRA